MKWAEGGQLLVIDVVFPLHEWSFYIIIREFGIEKRAYGDQLPLIKTQFNKINGTLELFLKNDVESVTYYTS